MRWALVIGFTAVWGLTQAAHARPPLGDPVTLNIGINCQWQQRCIKSQSKAMKRALKYVKKEQPPLWRVQLCNRNAGRQRMRVDWVGFDNCIRNAVLRPVPARIVKPTPRLKTSRAPARKGRRTSASAAPPTTTASTFGERG
jgi:hypothetical protein